MIEQMCISDYKQGFHIGMHGLGFKDGISKKNTLDCFLFWYKKGIRFFETDIALTSDQDIVLLAHEFNDRFLHRLEIFDKPDNGTWSSDYVKRISVGPKEHKVGFMFWEDLCGLIKDYSDCSFMLDLYGKDQDQILQIVERIDKLANEIPGVQERILVEVYTITEAKIVSHYHPSVNLIACIDEKGYCFFPSSYSLSEKCSELATLSLGFISCPYKSIKQNRELISFCNSQGTGVLSFSRFDLNRHKKKALGITVNLVDVYTGKNNSRKYLRIPKSLIDYGIHRIRLFFLQKRSERRGLKS